MLEFGPYRVDCDQRLLTKGSDVVPLAPKIFDTLLVLVEGGGRILEKENLLKKVWPDAFVEEGSLARNISTLRKALGESPHDRKYIVTVPKRGYRFAAKVISREVPDKPASGGGASDSGGRRAEDPAEPLALCGEPETFVGRESEKKRLTEHFQRMLGGSGKLVFLTGEAGIGKSSLAENFMRSVRHLHPGVMLATGRAVEQYGTGEAYLPFLDALSTLLREGGGSVPAMLRAHAPTWCLQLPAFSCNGDLDQLRREATGATKERMLREMGDALGALASAALTAGGPALGRPFHHRPAPLPLPWDRRTASAVAGHISSRGR
jgi:DNA-binding winged helix-turn-helix (wHTH) protein